MAVTSEFKSKIHRLSCLEKEAKVKLSIFDRMFWIGATPPLVKLLWKCGMNVRPIIYWTKMEIFLFISFPFWILTEFLGWVKSDNQITLSSRYVVPDLWWHLCAVGASVFFGAVIGIMTQKTRKKIGYEWNQL